MNLLVFSNILLWIVVVIQIVIFITFRILR